jgi:ribosomal protein S18 acetylase RimI-like enzyme
VTSSSAGGTPVVRPATEHDLPLLMGLFDELAAFQRPWRVFTPRPSLAREMRRRYQADLDDPDAVLLVAELDGEVVGMASGRLQKPSSMSEELAVELGNVFVKPEHRDRGVAGALTTEVARFAGERGVDRLTLKTFAQNEEALVAWRKLGFEPRMVQMTAEVNRLRRRDRAGRRPGPSS